MFKTYSHIYLNYSLGKNILEQNEEIKQNS